MAAAEGNQYAAKSKIIEHQLRAACQRDDYKRIRKGCETMLDLFSDGDRYAAGWVRDTLDGKPVQRIEASDDGSNALTSLQVLFVGAATRLANAQADRLEHRVIDAAQHEPVLRPHEAD